ncbi:MAG: D-tyrosyl-tRNA(Tyr) deacylase [Desulfurellaceae bacterium]|nr:D-tyrosyl-tRNA(Tyr) deacylase [Desulfurellaceae bacterium]
MKAVIQRVKEANVEVDGRIISKIGNGLLVFLCVCVDDKEEDTTILARKIAYLRIFDDNERKFNRSVVDVGGEVLLVSEFTLAANIKKGRRPDYLHAAEKEEAIKLMTLFEKTLSSLIKKPVPTGKFGAHMIVNIKNDGPVTLFMNSKDL